MVERGVKSGYGIMGDGGRVCCVVLDYCYADLEYSSVKLARRVSRSNA